MIYERMNINMRFDLFGILHTQQAPHTKQNTGTFAEVFFNGRCRAGGGGCSKNGLGDKTMLGQSRNNNGSVRAASIERERERKGAARGEKERKCCARISHPSYLCAHRINADAGRAAARLVFYFFRRVHWSSVRFCSLSRKLRRILKLTSMGAFCVCFYVYGRVYIHT